jgi:hypothetical protein
MKRFMTGLAFLIASLVGLYVATMMREPFRSEFLDESSYKKTLDSKFSSFDQVTNHFTRQPEDVRPVEGSRTAHQVNQYFAHR